MARSADSNRSKRRVIADRVTLAVELGPDGELPTEFRIFKAGWNETTKGRFLFDAKSAALVMAAYERRGIDLMIDLEHQSLDPVTPPEPTARDARGWMKLEIRNGELWATNVSWTPDGASRLAERRQRYVSPAFAADPKTNRIQRVLNIAIVAMPATNDAAPLVAAAERGDTAMTLEEFLKVVKALGIDMSTPLDEAMAKIKGEPAAESSADATDPAAADPAMMAAAANQPPAAQQEEQTAASARLVKLTGKENLASALDEVETWRKSHVALSEQQAQIDKDRAALELAKRRENVATLIRLGAETPHTSGAATGTLVDRLLNEPIEEQNARVKALLSARGGHVPAATTPPAGGGSKPGGTGDQTFNTPHGVVTLTARELATCKEVNAKPEEYAANKAIHEKAKANQASA